MTAPVPVTPTEAAERLLAWDDRGSNVPRWLVDEARTLARFVAALPAEPAADARHPAEVELAVLRHTLREVLAKAEAERARLAAPDVDAAEYIARVMPHLLEDAPLPAPPTEDDTERVERVARLIAEHDGYHYDGEAGAIVCLCGFADPEDDDDGSHARHVAAVVLAALPPAQPDPATVERTRTEGREQAAQAVRALDPVEAALAGQHAWDIAADAIRALSSATPSAPEGTRDA